MEQKRIDQLLHVKRTTANTVRTIHKLLQVMDINKRDIKKLEREEPNFIFEFKKYCEYLIANLYEYVIDRPRQAQQYMALAKEQEQYYNLLFGEQQDAFITPDIVIKREESATSITIIDEE